MRYFHGCYSVGDDRLWGVNRRKKGAANTLAALKSIRAARPDGAPIYVILDNLSAHKGTDIRRWAKKNKVEPSPTRQHSTQHQLPWPKPHSPCPRFRVKPQGRVVSVFPLVARGLSEFSGCCRWRGRSWR
ncbi:hypothetical protein SGFS_007380 [Streptomyces graminofaciens]|uniref:Transposase n=1 Tax=Streptomyces graminofaciens TaxID=68212 RepID=A0ABN5V8D7_9ACTN|nr:hypothetical protein SGFS_007380 [Streptomyces graminofaciens]